MTEPGGAGLPAEGSLILPWWSPAWALKQEPSLHLPTGDRRACDSSAAQEAPASSILGIRSVSGLGKV